MRNDHTAAEKAQIGMGAGFAMGLAARMLVRFAAENPALQLAAACLALVAAVLFCYGVGQFAVSQGRSAAWGFSGFVGYIILRFVLKPKPQPSWTSAAEFQPTPSTPPGFSPTNY